jgi:hypothetical protein
MVCVCLLIHFVYASSNWNLVLGHGKREHLVDAAQTSEMCNLLLEHLFDCSDDGGDGKRETLSSALVKRLAQVVKITKTDVFFSKEKENFGIVVVARVCPRRLCGAGSSSDWRVGGGAECPLRVRGRRFLLDFFGLRIVY